MALSCNSSKCQVTSQSDPMSFRACTRYLQLISAYVTTRHGRPSPAHAWSVSWWTIALKVDTGSPLILLQVLTLIALNLLMSSSVMQPMANEYVMDGSEGCFTEYSHSLSLT